MEHLPRVPQTVRLRRPGVSCSWEAQLQVRNEGKVHLLRRGWKQFVDDNALRQGDLCLFQPLGGGGCEDDGEGDDGAASGEATGSSAGSSHLHICQDTASNNLAFLRRFGRIRCDTENEQREYIGRGRSIGRSEGARESGSVRRLRVAWKLVHVYLGWQDTMAFAGVICV